MHIIEILSLTAKIILVIVLHGTIGYFALALSSVKIERYYFRYFIYQIIGATTIITITATLLTGGKTIMMGFILLYLAILLQRIKNNKFHLEKSRITQIFRKASYSSLLPFLSVTIIITTLIVLIKLLIFNSSDDMLKISHVDYGFYAKLSSYLVNYSKENGLFDYYNLFGTNIVQPYHYYEIWLNGILTVLFGNTHFYNILFITYPYGITVLIIGYLALIESYTVKISWRHVALAFSATFASSIYFPLFNEWEWFSSTSVFTVNIWSLGKLFTIYWFLVAALLCFRYRLYYVLLAFLLTLPIAYITTAPAIFISVGSFILISSLTKKIKKSNLSGTYMYGITGVIAIFIFYFYKSSSNGNPSSSIEFISTQYLHTFINVIGGTVIQITILFFVILLVFIANFFRLNDYKYHFQNLIFPAFLFSSGLIAWAFLHNTPNSIQLFTNLAIPMINIAIFLMILWLSYNSPHTKIRLTSIITLLSWILISSGYTIEYAIHANSAIPTKVIDDLITRMKEKRIGIYLKSSSSDMNHEVPSYSIPRLGYYLLMKVPDFDLISISSFSMIDLFPNNNYFIELQKNSVFYNYVSYQKREGIFYSIEKSQVEFIKKYEIGFLIAIEGTVVPDAIKNISTSTIFVKETGDTVYFFKP